MVSLHKANPEDAKTIFAPYASAGFGGFILPPSLQALNAKPVQVARAQPQRKAQNENIIVLRLKPPKAGAVGDDVQKWVVSAGEGLNYAFVPDFSKDLNVAWFINSVFGAGATYIDRKAVIEALNSTKPIVYKVVGTKEIEIVIRVTQRVQTMLFTYAKYSELLIKAKIVTTTTMTAAGASLAHTSWQAATGSVTGKLGTIGLILATTITVVQWYADYQKGNKDIADLFAAVGVNVAKIMAGAAITAAVVPVTIPAVVAGLQAAKLTALSVLAATTGGAIVITIGVAVVVGIAIDFADVLLAGNNPSINNDKFSEMQTAKVLRWVGKKFDSALDDLRKNAPDDYKGYKPYDELGNAIWGTQP